jgi:S-adenosylmethionine synthetase
MKVESFIHCGTAISQMPFEIVEIKGRGHPDTICDLICEQVSRDLLKFYKDECGHALHYNVDKALLVGGKAVPRFGGGSVTEPAKLYLGDRATDFFNGKKLDLSEVINSSVTAWLGENLRYLKLGSNLSLFSEIRSSSGSLSAVEERAVSNDTSVGVGSWPPSPLEKIVVALEGHLNSKDFKSRHPETGEDIKIMAIRTGHEVKIICAIAMVDRFISSLNEYLEKKISVASEIEFYLQQLESKMNFAVEVNCLDKPELGIEGLHLTVTGLSCENGDSGQVGRGNRVNKLISFLRPQTMEAWAGKNPVTHVGKIYSFAAQNLAKRICEAVPEVRQASLFLVGQIGAQVKSPAYVCCDLAVAEACDGTSLSPDVNRVIQQELERADIFEIQNMRSI